MQYRYQEPANAGTRSNSSGQRGVSVVDGTSRVKLFSRNGNDISASFPDVAAALSDATAGRSVTFDGELVALNSSGRPDFGLLQRRMHVAHPSAALLRSVPVTYFVFDVLDVDGESGVGCRCRRI